MKIQVWDLPTRVFHWLLVISVVFLIVSGKTGILFDWHQTAGVLVLSLLIYRLIWGFWGSTTARFSDFIYSPLQVLNYAKGLLSRKANLYIGHNPVGGFMVLVMLLLLLFQAITGLFSSDDILVEGALYSHVTEETAAYLTQLHHMGGEWLLPVVALHIAAIIFYRIYKKHDLLKPMLHGKLEVEAETKKTLSQTPAIYGLALLLASYMMTYLALQWLAGV